MSDRELLEKAAKAAGIPLRVVGARPGRYFLVPAEDGVPRPCVMSQWNPLKDDGDAMRLAVTLNLRVVFHPVLNQSLVREYHATEREWSENGEHHADPYAATRRAIVRAAAAIGESM